MMNNTNCFLTKLSTVLFGCYAVTVSAAPNPASKDYVNSTMIGRAAYGGVVFFTYLSGGVVHGLVAATADELGGAAYNQAEAIARCAAKSENGYTDWFLPNKAQITALFNNRFAINPNDFNGGFRDNASSYWSSSTDTGQGPPGFGWGQDFGTGAQASLVAVGVGFSARCVRAF
jgi:hypothetical protein